jgi:diguanylate cyclase (GGDEF)-like protein
MKVMSLKGIVSAIGTAVALVTALSIPTAYFASGYHNLSRHLDFRVGLNSDYLSKYIVSHPSMWQFQRVRLAELLGQTDGLDKSFRRRVVDSANKVVLDEGDVQAVPTLSREGLVVVAGSEVARIQLEASLRPLLTNTAMVAAFGVLLGMGIFFTLRIFPLRVLDRTIGQLERINRHFDAATTHMSQGLCMFDAGGRLVVNNDRYVQMYELRREDVKPGCALVDLLKHRAARGHFNGDPELYWAELQKDLKEGKTTTRLVPSGNGRKVSVINSPMPHGGWVATHEDITDQIAAQATISHMALHDALTNLPNRLFFQEQMESRLKLGREQKAAILCLDLDRFKSVNDTLGHAFGDNLLRQVADRMRGCLREGDILARLGGDEFGILQGQVNQPSEISALANRLIEAIAAPFDLDGHQATIGLSVGIATAPDDGREAQTLLKKADMALYGAKTEGKGTYRFFEPKMDRLMQARRTLELELRNAIVHQEFEIYYQPIINLRSEEVTSFEALLRWNHPDRGLIPPLAYISLAEETGLIVPIGEWVIRQACGEAAKWPENIRIAINVSPAQFKPRTLYELVKSALTDSGVSSDRLDIEITESVLLVDSASTLETLHQLRNLGVRISMDDFGTGYSSLGYLRSFPFDKIKIDRSFVHGLQRNKDAKAIITAVTGLGSSLGIVTTGEGVESKEEVEYLRHSGCTEAQGYFFSKPRPASEVLDMLAQPYALAKRQAVVAVA